MTRASPFGRPQFKTWSPSARIGYFTGPREPNGCRLWLGSLGNSGYACFRLGDQDHATVTRFIVGLRRGDPRVVMHSCDNRACVEPSHLSIGTHADNLQDMRKKGRHPTNGRDVCPRGHVFTPENTRVETHGGYSRRKCKTCQRMREANRSPRAASAILRGGK